VILELIGPFLVIFLLKIVGFILNIPGVFGIIIIVIEMAGILRRTARIGQVAQVKLNR
jgi:hypothetical protein